MAAGAGRRRRRRARADAALVAALAYAPGASAEACEPRFVPPPEAPENANRYNGIGLRACFNSSGPHHIFVISDWGGQGDPPKPADRRGPSFPGTARAFVDGVDDCAQQRVAKQMRKRARHSNPDYILNAGDNFYWSGITTLCGARPYVQVNTGQWGPIFEEVYHGEGLDGKQWLGVLGNHDYGGYTFSSGWDQVIGYTWGGPPPCTGRWLTPAQYWSARAEYPDFAVDYFFLDSNVFDVFDPHDNPDHNICSLQHTPSGASCGVQGPASVWDCPAWFRRLWRDQTDWLQRLLSNSTADWQVVVTHFPPTFGRAGWERLAERHGIDLIVSGHVHQQEVHYMEAGNFLKPTAWIVSGGGGGITSEGVPDPEGADDQYGFFDITLFKEEILIQAISHGGKVRSGTKVLPRKPDVAEILAEAKGHKDVIVVSPKLEDVPKGDNFAAGAPALLQDGKPEASTGGHRVVVGLLASSRRSDHPDASNDSHGVDPLFLSFSYGALVALLASVAFASYRFMCRERSELFCLGRGCSAQRPGCRRSEKSGCWATSTTPGYSSLSTELPEQKRKDQDERALFEGASVEEEALDEFTKPQDMGCMCWPTRSNRARYQRLEPA